jgi:benzoyl-CoA reductase/2-hydroxyglutaryl-CoA dehydratase subunit BcrC/BadD/HgdB
MSDPGLCPVVKSSLGAKIGKTSPYLEYCDVVILPLVCDAKMKMGEVISDFIPVWTMNVPHIKHTSQSKILWLEEIKDLKKRLEDLTGNRIYWQELKDQMETFLKMQTTFRRFYDLRKADIPAITGRDALLVSQFSTFIDDPSRWIEKTNDLSNDLESMIKEGICIGDPDAPRILLAGAPIIWPNWKIPQIIEESGGIIVADELCSGTRTIYDPLGVDEWNFDDMMRALADKYLLPCGCPCFTPNDERIVRILQMMEEFDIQGVFYHILRGCHIYNIESTKIKRILDKKKIPMLTIETEYSEEDIEQIRTRVEAFLMLVRARRKRRN